MNIKKVTVLCSELRDCKRILKQYGHLMKTGNYWLFPSRCAMVVKQDDKIEIASRYFNAKGRNKKLDRLLSYINRSKYFCNKCKDSQELYEAFYLSNNYDKVREAKLFSFDRQKILTICVSPEERAAQLEQYQRFHEAYSLPQITEYEAIPTAFEISMVQILPIPSEKDALGAIAASTVKYNENEMAELQKSSVAELIRFDYENREMNELLSELASKIDETLLDLPIPLCIQHGDLSKDNLMYGTSDGRTAFWWIDWEHARERIFFYDFFFYALHSAVYKDTSEALECYLRGENESEVRAYFEAFGVPYDANKAKDYFLVFAIVFLKERVCDLNNLSALKMYCDVLRRLG